MEVFLFRSHNLVILLAAFLKKKTAPQDEKNFMR